MLIESSSIPKYRDLSQPGDDVLVVVPQRLYAVFDGATDTVSALVEDLAQPGQTLPTPADMEHIIASARKACAALLQPDAMDQVAPALRAGIAGGQYGYCNRVDHSLGYAVLNGGQTNGPDMMCFVRPKSEIHSLELFTDGYPTCPTGTRVKDWEEAFFRVEAEDFSKPVPKPASRAPARNFSATTVPC